MPCLVKEFKRIVERGMIGVKRNEGVCHEGGIEMGRFESGSVNLEAQLEMENSCAGS